MKKFLGIVLVGFMPSILCSEGLFKKIETTPRLKRAVMEAFVMKKLSELYSKGLIKSIEFTSRQKGAIMEELMPELSIETTPGLKSFVVQRLIESHFASSVLSLTLPPISRAALSEHYERIKTICLCCNRVDVFHDIQMVLFKRDTSFRSSIAYIVESCRDKNQTIHSPVLKGILRDELVSINDKQLAKCMQALRQNNPDRLPVDGDFEEAVREKLHREIDFSLREIEWYDDIDYPLPPIHE